MIGWILAAAGLWYVAWAVYGDIPASRKFFDGMFDVFKRIVTLEPLRSRESAERRRAAQYRPVMVGDAVGGYRELVDVVWDEQREATDEAIARIDGELNRDTWNTHPGAARQARVGAENVCAWGVYHDPEYSRCECWDPGQ